MDPRIQSILLTHSRNTKVVIAVRTVIVFFALILAASWGDLHAQGLQAEARVMSPVMVRAGALSDLIADVLLDFTGGTAGTITIVNIQLFTSVPITSDPISGTVREALLLIGEPGPATQTVCGAFPCNVYRGNQTADNAMQWVSVAIPDPGPGAHLIVRMTNIRVATNLLAAAGQTPATISALVAVTGAIPVPVNNSMQLVALAAPGLDFSVVPANLTVCDDPNFGSSFELRLKERFPAAFKKRDNGDQAQPGVMYYTESGFVNQSRIGTAGLADQGTRLFVRLAQVPAGIIMRLATASVTSLSSGLTLSRLAGFDANFSGGAPTADTSISFTAGVATLLFEVQGPAGVNGGTIIDEFPLLIQVDYAITPVAVGQILAQAGFAPISVVTTASGPAPEPRFVDGGIQVTASAIVPCYTLLLQNNRFAVSVVWNTGGNSGQGRAVPFNPDSGYFWFFGPSTTELLAKIHDGRAVNGHFWVFLGALTDVGWTVTVRDTTNGAVRTYQGQQGVQLSMNDVNAF